MKLYWLKLWLVSVVMVSAVIIDYVDDDDDPDQINISKRLLGSLGVCHLPKRIAAATFSTVMTQVPKLLAATPLFAKREFSFGGDNIPQFNQTWTLKYESVEAMVNHSDFQSIIGRTHDFLVQLSDGSTVTMDYDTMSGDNVDEIGLDIVNVTQVTEEPLFYPLLECWVGNGHTKLARLQFSANLDSMGSAMGKFDVGLPRIPGICNLLLSLHFEHAVGSKIAILLSVGGSHHCDLGSDLTTVTRLYAEKHRYVVEYSRRRLAYSRHLDRWRLGRWKLGVEVVFADNDNVGATIHCVTATTEGYVGNHYVGDLCLPQPITLTG